MDITGLYKNPLIVCKVMVDKHIKGDFINLVLRRKQSILGGSSERKEVSRSGVTVAFDKKKAFLEQIDSCRLAQCGALLAPFQQYWE
jgi:hypothetical protein